MTEDEMVGWHHRLDGHGFEQALGVSEGQGSLVCCSPWGRRVRHEQLSNNIHSKAACILGLCEDETDAGGGCCDRTVCQWYPSLHPGPSGGCLSVKQSLPGPSGIPITLGSAWVTRV